MSSVQGSWRGANIIKRGLVLYLEAGSPNSYYDTTSYTWKDISGNYFHGTLLNNSYFTSDYGGCIEFMSGNGVSLPILNMPSSGARTISLWVKPSSLFGLKTVFRYGGTNDLTTNTLHFNVVSSGDVYYGFNSADFYTNSILTTNDFFNITCVYLGGPLNTSNVLIYVNAISQSLSTAGQNINSIPNTKNSNYTIAYDGSGNIYDGLLSTILLYDIALSYDEVLQNFNAQKSRFGVA